MKFKKAAVRKLWIIAVIKQDQWTSSRSFPANEEILFGFFWLIKTRLDHVDIDLLVRYLNGLEKRVNTSPLFCKLIGSLISSVLISSVFFFHRHFLVFVSLQAFASYFSMFFSRLVVNFNTILELPFSIDHICVKLILKDSVSFIGDLKSGILYQSQ